jgi:hypothetical protein
MRVLLLLPAVAIALSVDAQLLFGPDDMPDRGDILRYRNTSGQGLDLDLDLSGQGVVWDFSALPLGTEGVDTLLPVSAVPFTYQFYFNNNFIYPQNVANYALRGGALGGFNIPGFELEDPYEFYKTTNAGFRHVGFAAGLQGIPLGVRRVPVDIILRFPLAFGNVDTSISRFGVNVPSLLYFGQDQTRISHVDGEGTLILPGNTYECLRVRATLSRTDTVHIEQFGFGFRFPEPPAVEYRWLAKGINQPVLTITTVGGVVTSTRFFHDPAPPALPGPTFVVFPNPATDEIHVVTPFGYEGEWVVVDAIGREMRPPVRARPGELLRIGVEHLAAGAYTLRLMDGKERWSSRFVVQR